MLRLLCWWVQVADENVEWRLHDDGTSDSADYEEYDADGAYADDDCAESGEDDNDDMDDNYDNDDTEMTSWQGWFRWCR